MRMRACVRAHEHKCFGRISQPLYTAALRAALYKHPRCAVPDDLMIQPAAVPRYAMQLQITLLGQDSPTHCTDHRDVSESTVHNGPP